MKTVLLKVLGSLFAVWHIGVLLLGPAPGSYTVSQVWPIFRTYLNLLHMENYWAFFAPDPSAGVMMRYIIQDDAGKVTWFKFTENLSRSDPLFLRQTSLQNDLDNEDPWFRRTFADWLGRHHADLNPRYVQYAMCYQKRLFRGDWLAGHRPLEDGFMSVYYSEVIPLPVDYQAPFPPPPPPTASPEPPPESSPEPEPLENPS